MHLFKHNLDNFLQIPGADSSIPSQWTHVPSQLHSVPISMGFAMQQSRRAPHMMESSGGFNLGHSSNQVGSGNFSSMDAAAQFPDELGLGDTSSSVPSSSSQYSGQRNSGRGLVSNQPAPMSSPGKGIFPPYLVTENFSLRQLNDQFITSASVNVKGMLSMG